MRKAARFFILIILFWISGCSYTLTSKHLRWPSDSVLAEHHIHVDPAIKEQHPYLPPSTFYIEDRFTDPDDVRICAFKQGLPVIEIPGDKKSLTWVISDDAQHPFMVQVYCYPTDLKQRLRKGDVSSCEVSWSVFMKMNDGSWTKVERDSARAMVARLNGTLPSRAEYPRTWHPDLPRLVRLDH